jgi:enamine deaminase RidA (YjgF/YER057c/UK114 family)
LLDIGREDWNRDMLPLPTSAVVPMSNLCAMLWPNDRTIAQFRFPSSTSPAGGASSAHPISRPSQGRPHLNIRHTPASVAAPFGPYSHAVEVPERSRLLYISGEVGVLPDGTVPEGIEAQAEACWRNIIAILADAGMGVADLVKITTYLVYVKKLDTMQI